MFGGPVAKNEVNLFSNNEGTVENEIQLIFGSLLGAFIRPRS